MCACVCVHVCVCMCVGTCVMCYVTHVVVRGQPIGLCLFFYHAGLRVGTQVIRLGVKCPYQLRHLVDPASNLNSSGFAKVTFKTDHHILSLRHNFTNIPWHLEHGWERHPQFEDPERTARLSLDSGISDSHVLSSLGMRLAFWNNLSFEVWIPLFTEAGLLKSSAVFLGFSVEFIEFSIFPIFL